MPLTPGTRLGPYEVIAPLGAGGMGEVFRARDTRLDRDVAIKVLPRHLSAAPEVRARFEREAKTISSLNHPCICTLFDVGREGDTDYLVMELLEGETLAQRLEQGALPGSEVLEIGGQIAAALERAHRAGVIHRDLKPGNVMLTGSGAKLMDFGLARATGVAAPTDDSGSAPGTPSQSPTLDQPLTAEGAIVGTFQYMAPEQLEGSEADARSDLWALGCVLYEMATGRRAFSGKSQASLIGAIMHSEVPAIGTLAPLSPPGLERLVQACLAKEPADRLQNAHDVRMQLTWLAEGGSQAGVPAPVARRRRNREHLAWGLAAAFAVVALAIATFAWTAREGAEPREPFFATVPPTPSNEYVSLVYGGPIALSPDGTRLARVIRRDDETMISVYDFESGTTNALENTTGGVRPFWSPDCRWIGFFADGKLRKVEARGGPAQVLADAYNGRGGTWNSSGLIVFAPDIYGPLVKVSENGGALAALTAPDHDEVTHRNPYFLPDGKRFLFTEGDSRSDGVGRLMVGSLDDPVPHEVLDRSSNVQLSEGHLLFVRDNSLLAQAFDEKTLTLSGPIVPIAEDISYWSLQDAGNFSATHDGLLVYGRRAANENNLAWFARDGSLVEQVSSEGAGLTRAIASSDLEQVGLVLTEAPSQGTDIWLLDMATRQRRRMTFVNSTTSLLTCAFSPDSREIVVSAWRNRRTEADSSERDSSTVWIQSVSTTEETPVLEATKFYVNDWSPDGKVLLGWSQRTGTSIDITFVRLDDEERRVRDLVNTRFRERGARFSPDGGWVVYESNESGRSEVYLVDFPDAKSKRQVSLDGGSAPVWARDGREILFVDSRSVMAVPVTPVEGGIELGPPIKLGFSETVRTIPLGSDGERILATQGDRETDSPPIQVVRNWSALLEREAR